MLSLRALASASLALRYREMANPIINDGPDTVGEGVVVISLICAAGFYDYSEDISILCCNCISCQRADTPCVIIAFIKFPVLLSNSCFSSCIIVLA